MRLASSAEAPPREAFTAAERRLIDRLTTPARVQAWLNALPYNTEPKRATLRSFRGVVREGAAHCFEAAMAAAVLLEQHGYPPLVMSLESIDELDHVIFVYRRRGRWGSVARSRDPGLHGRTPVFRTARALAASYVDPYFDFTGAVKAYQVVDLRELGRYDWRLADTNVWTAERFLLNYPHRPLKAPAAHARRMRAWYRRFRALHGLKPVDYEGRDRWTPLPAAFLAARGLEPRPPRRR